MRLNKLTRLKIWHQTSPDSDLSGGGGGGGEPAADPAVDMDRSISDLADGILNGSIGGHEPEKQEGPAEGKAPEREREPEQEASAPEGEPTDTDSEPEAEDGEPAPEWVPIKAKDNQGFPIEFEAKKGPDGAPVYRFKAAGEHVEASHVELIQGYQRQQDYSRKVNEVMEKAAALDPFVNVVTRLQADPDMQQLVIDYMQGTAAPPKREELVTEEMIRLAMREDPDKAEDLFAKRAQQLKAIEANRRTQEAQQAWREQYLERQFTLVKSFIPDYDRVAPQISSYLKSEGFSEQEVSSTADARYVKIANKARLYDEMMAKQRAPKAELEGKRQPATPPKTVKSGSGKQLPKSQTRADELLHKAQKSGRDSDWQAALTAMVPDSWVR